MKLLMCRGCGEFVPGVKDGEKWAPQKDRCPECDGTEFMDNDSGRTIDTGEAPPS